MDDEYFLKHEMFNNIFSAAKIHVSGAWAPAELAN